MQRGDSANSDSEIFIRKRTFQTAPSSRRLEDHLRKTVISLVLLILSGHCASAQSNEIFTGNVLLAGCRAYVSNPPSVPFDERRIDEGVCRGIMSTVLSYGPFLNKDMRFCPPEGTTPKQLAQVIVEYLDGRPDFMTIDVRVVANAVLRKKWVCPN